MKNKLSILLVAAIFIFISLGCSSITKSITGDKSTPQPNSSDSNKSLTDKTIEDVADGETTGVKECDDLIGFLKTQSETPDDNWVTKGIRDFTIGQVKKSLKESIEQNKDDKVKMAEKCTDLKNKFEKRLKEEQEKKENK
jgi:hypothetical protein